MIRTIGHNPAGFLAPVFPFIEMAKYLEHRRKDPEAALDHTERAIHHIERASQYLGGSFEQVYHELEHRRERLLGKLHRSPR